jgi:hypothetical protein
MMSAMSPSRNVRRRLVVDDQAPRTIVGELVGTVRAQRKHGELDVDNSRTGLKV